MVSEVTIKSLLTLHRTKHENNLFEDLLAELACSLYPRKAAQ